MTKSTKPAELGNKCERCKEKKETTCVFCLDSKSYAYIFTHKDVELASNLYDHRGCSACWQKWISQGHNHCPVCKQTLMVKMYNDLVCSKCEKEILQAPGFAPALKIASTGQGACKSAVYKFTPWACMFLIILLIFLVSLYAKTTFSVDDARIMYPSQVQSGHYRR